MTEGASHRIDDIYRYTRDSVVRETWVAAGQSGRLAYFDDKTLPVPLLQGEPRDQPLGGDALDPVLIFI